jgi:hypothetical protein
MSKGDARTAQTVVFGAFLLVGYFLFRGKHRYEVLEPQFDFDKSPATRHMVDMHRRVDSAVLTEFLDAQKEAAGPPQPPSPLK